MSKNEAPEKSDGFASQNVDGSELDTQAISSHESHTGLQRRLNNRQIQLIAAGGAIGTALFVTIGGGLARGGPVSLFLAFSFYSGVLALVNNGVAEMGTYMPVPGGFVRHAGHWVDDAFGFMAGWNFFLYQALSIPFEITALVFVLSFWTEKFETTGVMAGICTAIIVCYALLNIVAVKYFGEAEFWLSSGKIFLCFLVFSYTFVTMVGGNPANDAYGFRHWSTPFAEFRSKGDLGYFEGFLAALWSASFIVVGPEYITMVAAESQRPSVYIKAAFKTVYFRLCIFFVLGALTVSIVIPYNDPELTRIYFGTGGSSTSTAAGSPYVISMRNLSIGVFPSVVNALLMTSIFSAGNAYCYCSARTLHGLALEGRAPRFLTYTTSQGVPIYAFGVVLCFSLLSFLQLGSGSAKVLEWLVTIITGGGLINYITINITFLNYYLACKAQGVDRTTRSYYGRFQPYGTIFALVVQVAIAGAYGYSAFAPFNVEGFFSNYTMQLVAIITFCGWKIVKRTRYIKPRDVDLVWERPAIDAYEDSLTTPASTFWREIREMLMFKGLKQK